MVMELGGSNLAQIFELFFTAKGDLGMGIGLWVAKQLVEARRIETSVASSTEDGNTAHSFHSICRSLGQQQAQRRL